MDVAGETPLRPERPRDEDATAIAVGASANKHMKTSTSLDASRVASAPAVAAVDNHVQAFPKVVPMETAYKRRFFYVRDCYHEYYELVMRLLQSPDEANENEDGSEEMEEIDSMKEDANDGFNGVAVMGTPGIGTSMFMAYFFTRYSAEHPSALVTMASYNQQSVVKQVVVTQGGKRIANAPNTHQLMVKDARTKDPEKQHIWLLDGPPTTIPVKVRWVSFSSPHENWRAQLDTNEETCVEVFMPVWTLDELRHAAVALNRTELLLAIDDDQLQDFEVRAADLDAPVAVINYRFELFGGVARVCLSASRIGLRRAFKSLRCAVAGLDTHKLAAILVKEYLPEYAHRFLHFVPVEYTDSKIEVGSSAIRRLLAFREMDIVEKESSKIERIVHDIPDIRSVLGFSVKTRTYRALQLGCTINAIKLSGEGDDVLAIDVHATSDIHQITNTFEITAFDCTRSQLVTPFSKNVPSVDGFYGVSYAVTTMKRVLLFHVTASLTHPVNALGYSKVLKALGYWGEVEKSPHTAVALIFVVPKWNRNMFQAQPIRSDPVLDEAGSVAQIKGMRRETVATLKTFGIVTIADLRKFAPTTTLAPHEWKILGSAEAMLKNYESGPTAVEDGSRESEVLQRIPQYVWGI